MSIRTKLIVLSLLFCSMQSWGDHFVIYNFGILVSRNDFPIIIISDGNDLYKKREYMGDTLVFIMPHDQVLKMIDKLIYASQLIPNPPIREYGTLELELYQNNKTTYAYTPDKFKSISLMNDLKCYVPETYNNFLSLTQALDKFKNEIEHPIERTSFKSILTDDLDNLNYVDIDANITNKLPDSIITCISQLTSLRFDPFDIGFSCFYASADGLIILKIVQELQTSVKDSCFLQVDRSCSIVETSNFPTQFIDPSAMVRPMDFIPVEASIIKLDFMFSGSLGLPVWLVTFKLFEETNSWELDPYTGQKIGVNITFLKH
jgi:hypothetical protein